MEPRVSGFDWAPGVGTPIAPGQVFSLVNVPADWYGKYGNWVVVSEVVDIDYGAEGE